MSSQAGASAELWSYGCHIDTSSQVYHRSSNTIWHKMATRAPSNCSHLDYWHTFSFACYLRDEQVGNLTIHACYLRTPGLSRALSVMYDHILFLYLQITYQISSKINSQPSHCNGLLEPSSGVHARVYWSTYSLYHLHGDNEERTGHKSFNGCSLPNQLGSDLFSACSDQEYQCSQSKCNAETCPSIDLQISSEQDVLKLTRIAMI